MIFTFSIRDFGQPKFLISQFGHPVMKILAKSLYSGGAVVMGRLLFSRIIVAASPMLHAGSTESIELDMTVSCSLWPE